MLKDYYKHASTHERLQAIKEDDDLHSTDGLFIVDVAIVVILAVVFVSAVLRWFV